jgi:hypothetical protein
MKKRTFVNRKPRHLRRLLPLLGLALVTLLALLLFPAWVTDVLLVCLSYSLWILGLTIRSRPQYLYWTLPAVLGIVALILLAAYNVELRQKRETPLAPLGPVSRWVEWVLAVHVNPYANRYLYRKVGRLAEHALHLDVTAEAGVDPAHGLLPEPPPELVALLRERHSAPAGHLGSPEKWGLEAIVTYLESVLEVDHDQ